MIIKCLYGKCPFDDDNCVQCQLWDNDPTPETKAKIKFKINLGWFKRLFKRIFK